MSAEASAVIAAILIAYVLVFTLWASGQIETHQFVWWPLELVKLLLRTLWRTLTTGWKP